MAKTAKIRGRAKIMSFVFDDLPEIRFEFWVVGLTNLKSRHCTSCNKKILPNDSMFRVFDLPGRKCKGGFFCQTSCLVRHLAKAVNRSMNNLLPPEEQKTLVD